jgi:hypothetical protein
VARPIAKPLDACIQLRLHHPHRNETYTILKHAYSGLPDIIPITDATGQFLSPDPKKITRADFTNFLMRFQHAPDAHLTYKHLFVTHQQLVKLLVEHPALQPNLQQTFSTPANSKNQVYFMWDFILRTF